MLFKIPTLETEFNGRPELLKAMARDFDEMSQHFGIEATVTRVLQKIKDSSGVHEAGRAIDFRDEFDGKMTYSRPQRQALISFITAKYPRDDGYPSILWHSFNGGPHHFHLQVKA